MRISVVICAFTIDRLADLRAAVDSVWHQLVPAYEVIVIVDGNSELLAIAEREFPDVVALANRGPAGLSGARNTGIRAAGGEAVAFLDDDAVASPRWLARLADHYADDDVVAVGGAARPRWDAARPGWFPPEFDWVVGCHHRGTPTQAATVRNLIGCNMSFRSEVFTHVGGFDGPLGRVGALSEPGRTCDDTEFCIRVSRGTGGRIVFDPEAAIDHRVPASRGTWSYFRRRCYSEGLAKARVSRLAGSADGLSSERAYVTHVLPRALLGSIAALFARREAAGLLRGAAIIAGLTITGAGYAVGRLRGDPPPQVDPGGRA